MHEIIQSYIEGLQHCLVELSNQDIEEIADIVYDAYNKDKQIFILGNGGSASTASHFACDLGKGTVVAGKPRLRVISITDNVALITALANDIDYSSIFTEQLANLLNEGDVVIGISASGNSPNVVKAIEFARGKGATTLGLIGFGGGKLKELVDKSIILSSKDYGQVEDAHMSLIHIICYMVKARMVNG